MANHTIEPERSTVHGHFSRDLPPILEIEPGDTVRFRTLEAGWALEPPPKAGENSARYIEPRQKGKDDGHCLCGPVAVKGARPGMTLEIGIDDIVPGTWGWSGAGWREELGTDEGWLPQLWQLDAQTMTGVSDAGQKLALKPFMGVMGMPPNEPGDHGTGPPRLCGGNFDCKELVAGTRLFLPVAVEGGLFSTGDGHAVQGDGEVSGVAIECPMERVQLSFELHEMQVATPRARTAEGWLTLGLDKDLNEATNKALSGMLDLMVEQHGMNRKEALALASLVVDLRITQIVNGTRGVHAVLPHGAVR
ncbi:MAG: acetamidase [Candidatus Latescibacteria bacterium]|nr:acetamidase [Candidatus Latescibacterota bacterium]